MTSVPAEGVGLGAWTVAQAEKTSRVPGGDDELEGRLTAVRQRASKCIMTGIDGRAVPRRAGSDRSGRRRGPGQ